MLRQKQLTPVSHQTPKITSFWSKDSGSGQGKKAICLTRPPANYPQIIHLVSALAGLGTMRIPRIILLFHFHIHVRMGLHLDLNLARESVIGLNSTWGVVHFLFWLLLDYASSNWSEKCPLYIFILFSLSFNVIYNYEIHLHS